MPKKGPKDGCFILRAAFPGYDLIKIAADKIPHRELA
jgi:hypothetical protein